MFPSPHYKGQLPFWRYLLASLTGNEEGSKTLMVSWVSPTQTRYSNKILHTPVVKTPVHVAPVMLVVSYNVKSWTAQEGRLASSPKLVKRPHPPHATVVRLHEYEIEVHILTWKIVIAGGVWAVENGCYSVTIMRTLFSFFSVIKQVAYGIPLSS